MTRFRKAHKDANHDEVSDELEQLGYSVVSLHMVGGGVPDLLVGKQGETFLVELKSITTQHVISKVKTYSYQRTGKLEQSQVKWIERWQGGPVIVACTTEEVLEGIEQQLGNSIRAPVN